MKFLSFSSGNYIEYVPFELNIRDNTSPGKKLILCKTHHATYKTVFLFLCLKEWPLDK